MVGAHMPQNILKYEAKFVANFTARQCVFYLAGALAGLGSFFYLWDGIPSIDTRAVLTGVCCFPFFIWGTIKPFGENPEKIVIPFIIDNILSPSMRKKEIHYPSQEKHNNNNKDRAKQSKTYKMYT